MLYPFLTPTGAGVPVVGYCPFLNDQKIMGEAEEQMVYCEVLLLEIYKTQYGYIFGLFANK